MAEIVTGPLPPASLGICYSETQVRAMSGRYSRLKPVEPGDTCCACGQDCDGPGFCMAPYYTAYRVNGHPICARPKCWDAKLDEFSGKRHDCRCGLRRRIESERLSHSTLQT